MCNEKNIMTLASDTYRGSEWLQFAKAVQDHIDRYTVPQYGDGPTDQVEEFSVGDIATSIKRYANRMGTNARGDAEAERDLLKIAHYACIAWARRQAAK